MLDGLQDLADDEARAALPHAVVVDLARVTLLDA